MVAATEEARVADTVKPGSRDGTAQIQRSRSLRQASGCHRCLGSNALAAQFGAELL